MSSFRRIMVSLALFCISAGVSSAGLAPSPAISPSMSSGGISPSSSSSGLKDCNNVLMGMANCLSFVTPGSSLKVPANGCCSGLQSAVDGNPVCLCQLLGKQNSLGLPVDPSKAMALPGVCKVQTPPASLCSAIAAVPVGSPMTSGSPSAFSPSLAPAPASPADCMSTLLTMSDCLDFVTNGTTGGPKTPSKGCCSGLKGVVANAPQCLCQLLGKSNPLGIPIDHTKALSLPKSCKVDTPDPSLCAVLEGSSPANAPAASGPSVGDASPPNAAATKATGGSLSIRPALPVVFITLACAMIAVL